MASEMKTKKRKNAINAIHSVNTSKKVKKNVVVEATSSAPETFSKASKTSEAITAVSQKSTNGTLRPARKRAADFFDEALSDSAKSSEDAQTPPKKKKRVQGLDGKAPTKQDTVKESEESDEDLTEALFKGFESSDEDNNVEEQLSGLDLAQIPHIPQDSNLRKQLAVASQSEQEGPRVIYVGHIPHGFYEHQMRAYFSQFGDITRLRLSRNRKTGRAKHYAYIEFASSEVARIVAKTMDKYLLFNHILKVQTVSSEQVHKDTFKGANRRYKPIPRNQIEGRKLRQGMDREAWDRRITTEEERRKQKSEKLKKLGYEYTGPTLRSAGEIPKRIAAVPMAEDSDGEAPKALTEAPHEKVEKQLVSTASPQPGSVKVTEEVKVKKPKSETLISVGGSKAKRSKLANGKASSTTTKVKKTKVAVV